MDGRLYVQTRPPFTLTWLSHLKHRITACIKQQANITDYRIILSLGPRRSKNTLNAKQEPVFGLIPLHLTEAIAE
jgi:hypothetical protein